MRTSVLFKIGGGAILIAGLLGCKKQLKEYNPTGVTAETVYTTPAGFEGLVNAAYSYAKWWYGKEHGITLSEMGTDLWTSGKADVFGDLTLYQSNLMSTNAAVTLEWTPLYAGVNLCNTGIKGIDESGLSADLKKTRLAELKFLRAFYYWHIVETWGGVHFQLEPTDGGTVTATANRTPVETFYEQSIFPDLQFAVDNLPASTAAAAVGGRVTKAAAQAFLARMYLTRGKYSDALAMAKTVINSGTFALEPKFSDLWDMTKAQSKEVIWVVNYSTNLVLNDKWDKVTNPYGFPGSNADRGSNNAHLMFLSVYDQAITALLVRDVKNGRPFNRYKPTKFLLELFDETKDSRYNGSFQTVWFTNNLPTSGPLAGKRVIGDTAFKISKYVIPTASRPKLSTPATYYVVRDINDMFNADGTSKSTDLYPSLSKFMDPLRDGPQQAQSSRDVFVLRLAEMYLIAAEAEFQLGNLAGAKENLDVIRSRAALPGADLSVNVNDITLDYILDERAREMAGEQIRWFDLKRTGKLIERANLHNPDMKNNAKDMHLVRPIPRTQIDAVTNKDEFTQNPGYL